MGDSVVYEEYCFCPYCKSDDFKPIKPCVVCGTYEHEVDEICCENCKKEVTAEFAKMMLEQFTPQERRALSNAFDGDEIFFVEGDEWYAEF
jgi:hypothetical protein